MMVSLCCFSTTVLVGYAQEARLQCLDDEGGGKWVLEKLRTSPNVY